MVVQLLSYQKLCHSQTPMTPKYFCHNLRYRLAKKIANENHQTTPASFIIKPKKKQVKLADSIQRILEYNTYERELWKMVIPDGRVKKRIKHLAWNAFDSQPELVRIWKVISQLRNCKQQSLNCPHQSRNLYSVRQYCNHQWF